VFAPFVPCITADRFRVEAGQYQSYGVQVAMPLSGKNRPFEPLSMKEYA
jgi:hypothetical protein